MASWLSFLRSPAAADVDYRIKVLEETSLPEYGYRYFEHVLAEYLTSAVPDSSPPGRIAEVVLKYQAGRPVTWGDLYVLEKHVLRGQPFNVLRRRASGLRANFREIIGQRAYEGYLASRPPNENEPSVEEGVLRADLERLLGMLHWNYSLMPIRERIRTEILRVSGLMMGLALMVLLLLLEWTPAKHEPFVATLLLVAFTGALGGFVSLQRRIQTIPTDGDPLVSIFELENGKFTLYLAPISGAVFALFLYFAFLGELLAGGVFPENLQAVTTPGALQWDAAVAKLLIWSFIAGFAERFVPDTIGRLVDRGRDATAPPPPPSPPAPPYGVSSPPAAESAAQQRVTVDWRPPRAASPPWR